MQWLAKREIISICNINSSNINILSSMVMRLAGVINPEEKKCQKWLAMARSV